MDGVICAKHHQERLLVAEERGLARGREEERQSWIDDIMACIDGRYDNPNLAGELEDLMEITWQEWNGEATPQSTNTEATSKESNV